MAGGACARLRRLPGSGRRCRRQRHRTVRRRRSVRSQSAFEDHWPMRAPLLSDAVQAAAASTSIRCCSKGSEAIRESGRASTRGRSSTRLDWSVTSWIRRLSGLGFRRSARTSLRWAQSSVAFYYWVPDLQKGTGHVAFHGAGETGCLAFLRFTWGWVILRAASKQCSLISYETCIGHTSDLLS